MKLRPQPASLHAGEPVRAAAGSRSAMPDSLPTDLLAEHDWLRRLARSLVAGRSGDLEVRIELTAAPR